MGGKVKEAKIVMESRIANRPKLVFGTALTGLLGSPNIRANILSLPTERLTFAIDEPINF
jgi:hypothetical protein